VARGGSWPWSCRVDQRLNTKQRVQSSEGKNNGCAHEA
jgi:hypothetical protein